MNDPHVVALIYDIEHGASVDYEEAEPFIREEPAFRLEVKDKKARFELKGHYAKESAARESIEEYIRVWEFDACLNNGSDSFKLRFDKAEIKDRNPTPGQVSIYASSIYFWIPTFFRHAYSSDSPLILCHHWVWLLIPMFRQCMIGI